MAIKIHYDHRQSLPTYLKYSKVPTEDEYNEYLELYDEGVGGQGFHECLNFAIPEEGDVKIYLPPTCLPAQKFVKEEFVIFSFTYKQDKELPSAILGVHAGVSIDNLEGILRSDYHIDGSVEDLFYHASSNQNLTTLLTSPLPYDSGEGIFTPIYKSWGFGSRYIESDHAERIIRSAYDKATEKINTENNVERVVIEREIAILETIFERYFRGTLKKSESTPSNASGSVDKEIGYRGELEVYNREVEYAKCLGLSTDAVEWLSQGVPTSVYDIKSVRKKGDKICALYLEVKSSKMGYGENVYMSSRQIEFFKNNPEESSLVFANFNNDDVTLTYKSFDEIKDEFLLTPVKYKLSLK